MTRQEIVEYIKWKAEALDKIKRTEDLLKKQNGNNKWGSDPVALAYYRAENK